MCICRNCILNDDDLYKRNLKMWPHNSWFSNWIFFSFFFTSTWVICSSMIFYIYKVEARGFRWKQLLVGVGPSSVCEYCFYKLDKPGCKTFKMCFMASMLTGSSESRSDVMEWVRVWLFVLLWGTQMTLFC